MQSSYCENYDNCKLIKDENFVSPREKRSHFIELYCEDKNKGWEKCNRYNIKKVLGFCPEFVLPDTAYNPEEVITLMDQNIN